MANFLKTGYAEAIDMLVIIGSRLSSPDDDVVSVAAGSLITFVENLCQDGQLTDEIKDYIRKNTIELVQSQATRVALAERLNVLLEQTAGTKDSHQLHNAHNKGICSHDEVNSFIQETAARIYNGESVCMVLGQFRDKMKEARSSGFVRDSHLYQAKNILGAAIKKKSTDQWAEQADTRVLVGYLHDIGTVSCTQHFVTVGSTLNTKLAHLVNEATASLRGGVVAGVEIINKLKESLLEMVAGGGLTRPQLQEVANAIAAAITEPADGCVLATLEVEVKKAIDSFEWTGFSTALPEELKAGIERTVVQLQDGVASAAWILGQLRPVVLKVAKTGQLTKVQLSEFHKVISGHLTDTSASEILSDLCKDASREIRHPSMVTPAAEAEQLTAMERRVSALEQDRGRHSYRGRNREYESGRGYYDGRHDDRYGGCDRHDRRVDDRDCGQGRIDGRSDRQAQLALESLFQQQTELMLELERVQVRIMHQITLNTGRGRR